jgi:hypothetical protein
MIASVMPTKPCNPSQENTNGVDLTDKLRLSEDFILFFTDRRGKV